MPRLRRSNPNGPGYTREPVGDGFAYRDPQGKRVRDAETLERIGALVLPPAWQEVWICPWPNGHLQATGVDSAGRRQYRYHSAWTAHRDREKFDRALRLGLVLPQLRDRLVSDLDGRGLTRTRVLACAVRLIDLGLFRIGGEQYAAENGSFGIATVLREHVRIGRGTVSFDYPAKSGVQGSQQVRDPAVREVVRALKRRPDDNPELMGWWSPAERCWRDVRSAHINEYLREVTGEEVTAKDFRTWHATVLLAVALARLPTDLRHTARKRALSRAYQEVAATLGNTPAVARASYVDPRVLDRLTGRAIEAADTDDVDLVPLTASTAVARLLRAEGTPGG